MKSLLLTATLIVALCLTTASAQGGGQQQQGQEKKGPPPTPISDSKSVSTLNGELFRELVIDPTVPVVVAFTAQKGCKKCKAFMENYEATAEALGPAGFASFTVMDGGEEEGKGLMQMFNIHTGVPAMVLFNPELLPVQGQAEGSYMKHPVGFGGSDRSSKAMSKWILQAIASHQITRLEDEQDTDDLIAKYATHDVPKVILFTEKDQVVSPVFKAASHMYRYAALFGLVNVSQSHDAQEVADRYSVKAYPTVVSVLGSDVDKIVHSAKSPVNMVNLVEFVGRVALNEERRRMMQQQIMADDTAERKKLLDESKKVKALTPLLMQSEKEWTKECVKRRKGHCIAIFVDDINAITADIELLTETSQKLAKRSSVQSQIVIVDGQVNYDLAESFQANIGYPSVVFINPMKKGYHNLIGSYNAKVITNFFMDKAVKSKGKAYDPKTLPAFKETPAADAEEEEGAITDDES